MSEVDEDKIIDDIDLDSAIDCCKKKTRIALKKLYQLVESNEESTVSGFRQAHERINSLEGKYNILTKKKPESVTIDSSKIRNNTFTFIADRAFSSRWPWISIDCKIQTVKCNRCNQTQQFDSFLGFSGDWFDHFMGTHGACSEKAATK